MERGSNGRRGLREEETRGRDWDRYWVGRMGREGDVQRRQKEAR